MNGEPKTLVAASTPSAVQTEPAPLSEAIVNSAVNVDKTTEETDPSLGTEQAATEPKTTDVNVSERPWQEVVRRNMFAAGGGMTIAKSVKLSAITEDIKGVRQAWFRNLQQGPTQMVDLGQTFNQGQLSATVDELHDEYAILLIDGDRVRVQIGQAIADGVALVRPAKL
jgi:hypothetical protein